MSNIFEALAKSRTDLSNLIQPAPPTGPERAMQPDFSTDARVEVDPPPSVLKTPLPPPPLGETTHTRRTLPVQVVGSSPLFPFDGGTWIASEQYRIIRTKLVHHPNRPRMIVVSSATPQDGKTVTAINLAGALALKSPTLLLDADFRRSTMAENLGLPVTPGLSDVLAGSCKQEESIVQIEQFPSLHVMVAGKSRLNPAELLDSAKWSHFCKENRKQFEFVVVDSPPIAAVADFDLLLAQSDGVVLVIQPDHTKRADVLNALQVISKERLLGVVMNRVRPWIFDRFRHKHYYYYAGNGGAQ